MNRTEKILATVMAGCIIHNLCVKNDKDIYLEDYIQDGLQFVRQVENGDNVNRNHIQTGWQTEGREKRDELCTTLCG